MVVPDTLGTNCHSHSFWNRLAITQHDPSDEPVCRFDLDVAYLHDFSIVLRGALDSSGSTASGEGAHLSIDVPVCGNRHICYYESAIRLSSDSDLLVGISNEP